MNNTDKLRASWVQRKVAESETRRLARRPTEDSALGYARIQRARAKRARKSAARKREALSRAVLL